MGLVIDALDKDLYLDDFIWVLGHWEFRDDDPSFFAFPRYRGYIPIGKFCPNSPNIGFFYLSL